jgi:Fic-DOC domain mobile mystery protein B
VPDRGALGAPPDDGNTPLDENELDGLIPPHLLTRADLNQWEVKNIERAYEWLDGRSLDVLDVTALEQLHFRMFGDTWTWAGTCRTSDKTISPFHWTEVPRLLRDLVANTRTQHELGGTSPEELDRIAARFHHGLVHIHPWPNGNGRHARLATDLLLRSWGRPPFSWGGPGAALSARGDARARYIAALKTADGGNFAELNRFVRS